MMESPNAPSTDSSKTFLRAWLSQINFTPYEQKFVDTGYDNSIVLSNLEEKDLDAIGITLPGHR
jgi:hypothetical protein